jgi:sulfhydrogenase subunit beta (sulfur reductase)
MSYFSIRKEEWDSKLEQLISSHTIFATVSNESGLDYELVRPDDIKRISYNKPKPATPLKTFFLPVRENVTSEIKNGKPRIIIGAPNCDIEGINLLDEIYLDKQFTDMFYASRRKSTILISSDCFGLNENCHCTSYGIKPSSSRTADLSVIQIDGSVIFRTISNRGEEFIHKFTGAATLKDEAILAHIDNKIKETETMLLESNKDLPDHASTGKLIEAASKIIWEKYSSDCVSCGACTTICPTCSCFLLIDRPGFGKIKQMDACQYPGFERVAGGEDVLHELPERFRNRYMCKYVWKQRKFLSVACTGCGRCIEACIGKISKNKLFRELAK